MPWLVGRLPGSRSPAYRSPTCVNSGQYEPLSDGVRRANYVMRWRFGFDLVREFAARKKAEFLPIEAERRLRRSVIGNGAWSAVGVNCGELIASALPIYRQRVEEPTGSTRHSIPVTT